MANVFRYAYVNVCCCACECFRRMVIRPRPGRQPTDDTEAWKNRFNQERAAADGTAASTSDVNVVDDFEDEEEDDDEQKMSVPLTVTILMLGGFIFMGALLFGVLERWDWLTSAYCCFVIGGNFEGPRLGRSTLLVRKSVLVHISLLLLRQR